MSTKIGIVCGIALALAASAVQAEEMVFQATEYTDFKAQFCSADRSGPQIFVLPAAAFHEQSALDCEEGSYTLRSIEPADDPGHYVFNVDPPHGVIGAFDCDGKADEGMPLIAINCLPVFEEEGGHSKT